MESKKIAEDYQRRQAATLDKFESAEKVLQKKLRKEYKELLQES
jgi:thymidylate kinase